MNEVSQVRRHVLKEIKFIKRFFDKMESGVKDRNANQVYSAYVFLKILSHHMMEGDLTPMNIELSQHILHDDYIKEKIDVD